jgi:hypothetical protein
MAAQNQTFIIWKGDSRLLRFFVDDVANLTDFEAVWTLAETATGEPFMTKTSSPAAGITINAVSRFVDVALAEADFDYDSTVVAGTYFFELTLISSGTARVASLGTLTVHDAQNKFHFAE